MPAEFEPPLRQHVDLEAPSPPSVAETPREWRDLDARLVAKVGVGLFMTVGVIGLALVGLLRGFESLSGSAGQLTASPGPGFIWPHEGALREAADARAARQLGSYGWVDRRAGVVHVPIERAMALVAGRGLRWRLASPDPGVLQLPPYRARVRK